MSKYHKVSRAVGSLPPGVMSKDGVLLMSEVNPNYDEIVSDWDSWSGLGRMFSINETTYRGYRVAIFAPLHGPKMPPEQLWRRIEESLAPAMAA